MVAALGLVAGGAYLAYSVFAAQARPGDALAQAPLNTQVQVPPAFIMAVDDSNSMTFERIFPGGDGRMLWNSSNGSFFSSSGVFFNVGPACANNSVDCYLYLFPHDGFNSSYSPGRAIPPLDAFGFARSHAYNAGYFNPAVVYEPWRNADGVTSWPNASPTAARADPRAPGTYGSSFTRAYNVTYDLTSNRATNEPFQMVSGMTIPNLAGRGMRYRTTANGTWNTGATTISGNPAYGFDYFPATFYLPAANAAPAGYRTADANRPIVNNACGPGCNMRRYEIKPANYNSTAEYDAAIQNFANWFQYHRNRLLSMVGAMTHSVAGVNNMRVGYFTINNRVNVTMHDLPAARTNLYSSFYGLQAGLLALGSGGGTPNRDAVSHMGEQFRRTGAGAPITYACQRNGGMLFTDGFTNSGNGPTNVGNVDTNMGSPFADNFSNTIADIAARYYVSGTGASGQGVAPLRTGTGFPPGRVPVPPGCSAANPSSRLNCQADLHMNFYGVTLGARGAIYDVNQAATRDPFGNPPNWNAAGNPRDSDGGPTVDEIWHASLNTRGEFINANTPADITAAMRRILASVSSGASPSGGIALSGARIGPGSLAVTPAYSVTNQGTDWSSTLTAERVLVGANRVARFENAWEASARMRVQGAAARNVFFARNGLDTPNDNTVVQFNASNISNLNVLCRKPGSLYENMRTCTAANLAALNVNVSQALNYLLGTTTLEVRNGGRLRDRTTVLGDIVNSTPVVSAPTDDYGYRGLPTVNNVNYGSTYGTYLSQKASADQNRRYMVYAGANDGMLHAFDGGLTAAMARRNDAPDDQGGREKFAYIPATSIGHMGNLLLPYNAADQNNQAFQHRYYVDGPVVVSDAYRPSNGWSTVLVGTSGAGGRSVFALDVAAASRSAGSFSASDRLWEISDMNTSLPQEVRDNIGHVLGRPVIVPVRANNGSVSWKAIFGNGYNSASGKAVLFVVDIASGTPTIRMIEAQEPANPNSRANPNGLGNIVVVDRWRRTGNGWAAGPDGFADTVYAGDQKGALWKFDLTSTATSVTQPVFVTQTQGGFRQPITGGIAATAGPAGGVMLLFGTGSFSFYDDPADTSTQSVYAVNDTSVGVPSSTLNSSNLARSTVGSATGGGRIVTRPGSVPTTSRGWYFDLPSRERVIGYPTVTSGNVFLPTYVPDPNASGCSAGGSNWLFGLNARTGAPALSSVRDAPGGNAMFDADNVAGVELTQEDGTSISAPVRDVAVMTLPRTPPPGLPEPGGPGEPSGPGDPPDPADQQCWMVVSVAGANPMYLRYPCGRQSWRQVQ
nr:PilC/PilY family type IV pilus protein [Luteimonas abyssi]